MKKIAFPFLKMHVMNVYQRHKNASKLTINDLKYMVWGMLPDSEKRVAYERLDSDIPGYFNIKTNSLYKARKAVEKELAELEIIKAKAEHHDRIPSLLRKIF